MLKNLIALTCLSLCIFMGNNHAAQSVRDTRDVRDAVFKAQWNVLFRNYLPSRTGKKAHLLIVVNPQKENQLPLFAQCAQDEVMMIKCKQDGGRSLFPDLLSFNRVDLPIEMEGVFHEIHVHRNSQYPLCFYDALLRLLHPQGKLLDYYNGSEEQFPLFERELKRVGFQQIRLKWGEDITTCRIRIAIAYAERDIGESEIDPSLSGIESNLVQQALIDEMVEKFPHIDTLHKLSTIRSRLMDPNAWTNAEIDMAYQQRLCILREEERKLQEQQIADCTPPVYENELDLGIDYLIEYIREKKLSAAAAAAPPARAAASPSIYRDDDESSTYSRIVGSNEKTPLLRVASRTLSSIMPRKKFFSQHE